MASRLLFSNGLRRASTVNRSQAGSSRLASTVGHGPSASSKGMLNFEPEVYPLLTIVFLASCAGTYFGFNKLFTDQDLRLKAHQGNAANHETLNLNKEKFGVQAPTHTYKDWQGWTRIGVGERKRVEEHKPAEVSA